MSTEQKQVQKVVVEREGKPTSFSAEVSFGSNVIVNFVSNTLNVKGPKGTVSKDFSKVRVILSVENGKVKISSFGSKREDAAVTNTAKSVIRNMIVGVTQGFVYRMKVVYAHFPVTIKTRGKEVLIENFYGERSPRVAQIVGDSKVSTQGDDVVIQGISAEDVGQTAANIEQATTVRRKDQRVFLDGVYTYEKKIGW
jgi:large subunit ribosomal protein L6